MRSYFPVVSMVVAIKLLLPVHGLTAPPPPAVREAVQTQNPSQRATGTGDKSETKTAISRRAVHSSISDQQLPAYAPSSEAPSPPGNQPRIASTKTGALQAPSAASLWSSSSRRQANPVLQGSPVIVEGADASIDFGACGCGASGPTCCDDSCCSSPRNGCGGWFVSLEAVFSAYHRADGMRIGVDNGEIVNPGWDLTPRATAGYAGCEGTGFRARWWDYNHNQESQNQDLDEYLSVDTFNLDAEIYDVLCLTRTWSLEVSGGVRFNNFEEVMFDQDEDAIRRNWFHGIGGIVGLEARRDFGCFGHAYGGLRAAVLFGDKSRVNVNSGFETFTDTTAGMLELAVGWELRQSLKSGSYTFLRVGAEWQNWHNFSSAFEAEDEFESHNDVGFTSFLVSAGFVQ